MNNSLEIIRNYSRLLTNLQPLTNYAIFSKIDLICKLDNSVNKMQKAVLAAETILNSSNITFQN